MFSQEATFRRAWAAVGMRARRGESLSTIEDDVISPSGLSEEHRSALSAHATDHLETGRRRYDQSQDRVRRQAGRATPARGGD
jgi:hypothetical protein